MSLVNLRNMGRDMEFYTVEQEDKIRPVEGQYTLHLDRKMVWLQKICFWVLKKLRCEGTIPCTKFRHKIISTRDFLAAISEQRDYYAKYHFNGNYGNMRQLVVVVGGDILNDLLGANLIHPAFETVKDVMHYQESTMRHPLPEYKTFVYDMDVIFAPNVKGAFVVPHFRPRT